MLKNRVELTRYIRFQLAQMSTRNEFHSFEQLCFELAKAKVATNVIPATGPVQAGGDRGRDFETFRSRSLALHEGRSGSIELISEEKIIFCCSLEKEIESKIKRDLSKVFSSEPPGVEICYFCSADIPIARRLQLQSYCKDRFGAELQIFDGTAISAMLADIDVFWIAEQFLAVPTEFMPGIVGDEEYNSIRKRWLAKEAIRSNGEFIEVKYLLRRSSTEANLTGDLSKWQTLMEGARRDAHTRRRATYELAMAAFGIKKDGSRARNILSDYFREFPNKPSMVEIQDAFSLIQRVMAFALENKSSLDPWKVREWRQSLARAVEMRLRSQSSMQDRYILEIIMGFLAVIQSWRIPKATGDAIHHWDRAVRIVESQVPCDATLIEHFVSETAQAFGNNDKFTKLLRRIDGVIESQQGKAFVADLRASRGFKALSAGNLIDGLKHLLEAKSGFLKVPQYRESLVIDLKLIDVYANLELPLAARYFAISAILGPNYDPADEAAPHFAASGAFKLAETYYFGGQGVTALSIFGEALRMQLSDKIDPTNADIHKEIDRSQEFCRQIVGALDALAPDIIPICKDIVASWPMDTESKTWLFSDLPMMIDGLNLNQKADSIAKMAGTSLTADLIETFQTEWCALNVTWHVVSPREYQEVAERIATVLQILTADYSRFKRQPDVRLVKISVSDENCSNWTYSLGNGEPLQLWVSDEHETPRRMRELKVTYDTRFDDAFALAVAESLLNRLDEASPRTESSDRMGRLLEVLMAGPPVSMIMATGRELSRRGGLKEIPQLKTIPWTVSPRRSTWLNEKVVS